MQEQGVSLERFNEAYSAYANDVLRLAYFYLADRQKAEDVCQEVFLRLYTGGGKIETGKEKPWLLRVTVNLCRDHWRSGWVKRVLLGSPALELIPDGQWDRVEKREEKEALMQAIARLKPEYREVILLHYFEEMNLKDVANALGIAEGTAASRLSRAKARLRGTLNEEA